MKIYFACSIRGGRTDAVPYLQIIEKLKSYGEVLTEHIGDAALVEAGEKGVTEYFIHERDMAWLKSADVLIAEVTNASLGVGYEIAKAEEYNKKVLCLYRPQVGKKLSAMILGSKSLDVCEYLELQDLNAVFDKFFKNNA